MNWFKRTTEVPQYKERDLKVNLKTCLIRLEMRKNKAKNNIQKTKREISNLLSRGDDENARILVEQIIKEEFRTEAFEELTVMCEEVQARLPLITASKRLPMELRENICTLIWAGPQIDVKEFSLIRQQFLVKFGANLDHEATCNIENCVSAKVIELLSPLPPEEVLVFSYLKSIANEYHIDWKPEAIDSIPTEDPEPEAPSVDDMLQSRLANLYMNHSKESSNQNSTPVSPQQPSMQFPLMVHVPNSSESVGKDSSGHDLDDVDEFEKMFAPIPNSFPSNHLISKTNSAAPKNQSVSLLGNASIQQITPLPSQMPRTDSVQQSSLLSSTTESILNSNSTIPLSDKDLEEEFKRMFGTSAPTLDDDVNEFQYRSNSTQSNSLKSPANSNISSESTEQEGASEYADLFSAPPIAASTIPQGGIKLPEFNIPSKPISPPSEQQNDSTLNSDLDADYSSLLARLDSLNQNESSTTTPTINLAKDPEDDFRRSWGVDDDDEDYHF